jgi:predicted amidohydrolase YtcJ
MPRDGSILFAWGFDPIYFTGRRMNLGDLDKVSTERPGAVAAFELPRVERQHAGVRQGQHHAPHQRARHRQGRGGEPTGELQENTAKYLAYKAAGIELSHLLSDEPATWRFARVAQLAGVTTATDLHNTLPDSTVAAYEAASASAEFPLRLLPAFAAIGCRPTRASAASRADEEEQRAACASAW